MNQPTLFDEPDALTPEARAEIEARKLAKADGPQTSHEAAKRFCQSGKLTSQEERIAWLSDRLGGKDWTAHELAAWSKRLLDKPQWLDDVQIKRRTKEMTEKDVLEPGPDRLCACGCGQVVNTHRTRTKG